MIMEINGQIHFNTARKFCLVSKSSIAHGTHLVHKNKTIFYAVTSDQILRKRTSPLTKAKAPCRRVSDKVEAT